MRISKLVVTVALALAAAPVTAHAQGVQGRWSMTFAGGGDLQAGGTVHQAGSGTVLGLPTRVDEKSFSDIYGAGYRVSFGVGYGVGERVEIIGNVNFGKSSSKDEVKVGDVAGLDLFGDFKEYKDLGVEGGVRLHFAPDATVRPYVNLVGGIRRVDAIAPTFSVPAANVVLRDVEFYDDSTVPTFGGDFGLGIALGPNVAIGVEAGLRWSGALEQIEGLAGTGLQNLNDEGARVSFPLLGTLTIRF